MASTRPPHPVPLPKGREGPLELSTAESSRVPLSPRGEGQDEGGLREAIKRIWHEMRREPMRCLGRQPARASPQFRSSLRGWPLRSTHPAPPICGARDTLIIADLHLEKGSRAASKGRLLPALDSRDTLHRLKRAVEAYRPERVICLGDSFDDGFAGERMAEADKDELSSLCASVDEWIWLGGNHDPGNACLLRRRNPQPD